MPGDIIVGIDEHAVEDTESLLDALEQYHIGKRVTLRYRRGERELQAQVILQ